MTKKEFRQSLPLLGYDASDTAAIDAIFDELDADGSGSLVQSELFAKLRQGLSVEIAAELRAGAVEFETEAKNRIALRSWAPVEGDDAAAQEEAARRLQARQRERKGLSKPNASSTTEEEEKAAVAIQACVRGKLGRKQVHHASESITQAADGPGESE